jgi:transposase-like protein
MLKRLFFDIEVSPNVVTCWRVGYKLNISPENIIKERSVISIAWKWQGESEVHALTWDKNQGDKKMLQNFLPILNEADEIVYHNGDRFDLPWLLTRFIFHKIPAFPSYKGVDTLKMAKKFYFNSNKLDYVARFLGLGGKMETTYGLWDRVFLKKDPEALKEMVSYNKKDVILLEQVYDRLSVYCAQKTHAGVLSGGDKWQCPHCGSTNVKKSKTKVTAAGTVQHQMVCKDCGKYYTISDSSFRKYLEFKEDEKQKKVS